MIGNPGTTSRLETVAQLELRRDVTDKNLLAFLQSRIFALESLQESSLSLDENTKIRNSLFSLKNAQKAYTGQLNALNDPIIMARRKDAENAFRASITSNSEWSEKYGGILDEMVTVSG